MNKDYMQTKSDGIIVFDENRKPREVEARENFEEILIQENVIEKTEDRIRELENALEGQPSMEEVNNRKYIPRTLPALAGALFLSPFIIYFLGGNPDIFTTTVNTIFGSMKEIFAMLIPMSLCCTIFGAMIEFLSYKSYKIYVKIINAKTIELEALRDSLEKDKAKLEQLKSAKTKPTEKQQFSLKVTPVNDREELKKLEWYSNYYYNFGYNLDKYYKAYLDGTLDSLLQQEGFDEQDRALLINYTKNKGQVLARKRTKKTKFGAGSNANE